MTPVDAAATAAAYLIGAVPFGLLFARVLTGKDPREHGSGNIGATNALRTSGKMVGALTLLADIVKGAIPVAIAIWLQAEELLLGAIALAAFFGHIFPIYLGFKGGKGVATMFGVLIPWMPLVAAGAFAVWFVVFKLTRYVSLASILAGLSMPILALALTGATVPTLVCLTLGVVMTIRHHSNIKRLIAGEESKTGDKSKC